MSAKPYCSKTAALIGWMIQNFPLSVDDSWVGNVSATRALLAPLAQPPVKKEVKAERKFTVTSITSLGAVPAKKTSDCFVGDRWSWRDSFDEDIPQDQPAAEACTVTTISCNKSWQPDEFITTILGPEWEGKSSKELGDEIIRRGLTLTNAQAEAMVELTVQGRPTGMVDDAYGNFYFTQSGNEEFPVKLGEVGFKDGSWWAGVGGVTDGYDDCYGCCFLLRNPATPTF